MNKLLPVQKFEKILRVVLNFVVLGFTSVWMGTNLKVQKDCIYLIMSSKHQERPGGCGFAATWIEFRLLTMLSAVVIL